MAFARAALLHPLLRMWVVAVLSLALPWQGLWAATMVQAPAGQQSGGMTSIAHGMAIDAPASAQMHGMPVHPPCHDAATADGTDGAASPSPHGQARCTHCAACGAMAAALPATLPDVPTALTPSAAPIAFAPRDLPTPWLGTPERPPQRRAA